MADWDDDDDWDDELVQQMDAVVANVQQQRATQAAPQPSQPSSPVAAAGAPPHLPPQHSAPTAPLQQSNGMAPTANGLHKPPLPPAAGRQGAALSAATFGGPPQQHQHAHPPMQPYAPPASHQMQHGAPVGHISAAAAELQARMPQAAGQPPIGAHGGDAAAQLSAVLQEKGRLEGQNRHLLSTLAQKEQELNAVKQRAAQLEKAAGPGGAGPGAHRSAFQVGEMQRQLDSARQQLTFREQEVEDLKRQYADRSERLRQAEAALADLKQQLKQQQRAEPQQGAADRRPSTGQPSTGTAAAQRGSGAKRRQSGGGPASAGTGSAPPAGTPAAPAVATGAAAAAAAPAAAPPSVAPPLLDPAVFAAAASLRRVGWMDQLMAACSNSLAVLTGAAPGPAADAATAGAAAPPTVLLLRTQSHSAAAPADPESRRFVAAFVQRLQQVACGMLPPAALLDSITSMAASSLTLLRTPAGEASGAALPRQRLQLMAAGLHVAQHLLALDGGCRRAALGGLASSSVAGTAALPGRAVLSSRVKLSGAPAAAAGWPMPAPAATAAQPSWMSAGSSAAALPATAQVMQQHPAAFGLPGSGSTPGSSLPSGLLPLLLTTALWLGPGDEAVAAGALGCLLELARALQGPDARAGLAPLFTSGALELFIGPPALRLQAIRLLQLLLEDASLARLFEGSLAQAAAARGEPGPPTATAGNSGGEGSATPVGELLAAPGGAGGEAAGGPQPIQAEGGEDAAAAGPWIGAAAIAERLLDSFVLDDSLAPSSAAVGGAPTPAAGSSGGGSAAGGCGTAVARAAMQLVAALREQRQHGILVYLLLDDACGAPGQMLAQRLVQLAEAALAQPADDDAALMPCPLPFPDGHSTSSGAGGSSSAGTLLHQQAAWQQRLRVAQEALTLLRGLLVDESCGVAAMDDLVTIPATARLTLTTLSRLGRLEPPSTAGTAAGPQPLPLAAWARAIGSSTDQASIAEAASGAAGQAGQAGLPVCAVEDVVYLSRSLRRRVLLRLSDAMVQG